jgi:thiol:disulfide interchange protein
MFCARCGRDLGEEQGCIQCGWSVDEIDSPLGDSDQPHTNNGYAIISFICGIVSISLCGGGGVVPIIGLVLGILGHKSDHPGMAKAGIILNTVVLILSIMFFVLIAMIWLMPPSVIPGGRCC